MSGAKKIEKEDEGDCDCYAKSRNIGTCPPVRNVTHPLRYYELTPEEIRALEECDKESFYQRCLPFSTLLATVTYAGIRSGEQLPYISMDLHRSYLSRSRNFGAVPKVMLAILLGHALGRISYLKMCEAKLRRLPTGSHLGNVMRQYHSNRMSAQEVQRKK